MLKLPLASLKILTIHMKKGKTTEPESRTIRRRTRTYATTVDVHNLHVHSPTEWREDENLTWQRDLTGGRDSAVGIATRYGLDGPGIESR
jgi:hypothetical protein